MFTPLSLRSEIETLLSLGFADAQLEVLDLSTQARMKVNGIRHETINGVKRVALTYNREPEKVVHKDVDAAGKSIPAHRKPHVDARI